MEQGYGVLTRQASSDGGEEPEVIIAADVLRPSLHAEEGTEHR